MIFEVLDKNLLIESLYHYFNMVVKDDYFSV